MKEVVYTKQALLQFEESVKELVEQGYFGDEDYAVMYMRDIFRYFPLNLQYSVSVEPCPFAQSPVQITSDGIFPP